MNEKDSTNYRGVSMLFLGQDGRPFLFYF